MNQDVVDLTDDIDELPASSTLIIRPLPLASNPLFSTATLRPFVPPSPAMVIPYNSNQYLATANEAPKVYNYPYNAGLIQRNPSTKNIYITRLISNFLFNPPNSTAGHFGDSYY